MAVVTNPFLTAASDASSGASPNPWGGKNGRGIKNIVRNADGSGYVQWGNGAVAKFGPGEEGGVVANVMNALVQQGEISTEDADKFAKFEGYNFSRGENGGYTISGRSGSFGGATGSGGSAPAAGTGSTPSTGGGGYSSPTLPAPGGSYGGGGGSGGSSGGSSGHTSQGSPWGGGGGGGGGGTPIVPMNPGSAGTPIDPSKPMGIKPITPGYQPGANYFGAPKNVFPSAGNPFDGLNEQSTLYDVISKIAGAQVGNQQAALDILGGTFNESLNGANGVALRGQVGNLLANPYSMDEQTIQRILGKTTDRINNGADRLAQEASARAASAGLRPDSGTVLAQQNAIKTNAANAAAGAERDTRVQAAIQNQQDLRSAIGTGGQAIAQDIGMRRDIGRDAALGVLGETSITGDAFLTNALLAAQGKPQINVNGLPVGMTGGTRTVFTG